MDINNNKKIDDLSAFTDDSIDTQSLYNKHIETIPVPEKNIGVDTKDTLLHNVVYAGESSQIDISQFESFLSVSQKRDEVYQMIDTMAEDSIVASILETYAEDATEYNDQGRIVWAESSDSNIASYVTFLLDTLNVDKYAYQWAHSLCKYGDLYLRLYRESEYKDPIFDEKNEEALNRRNLNENLSEEEKKKLEEDVKVRAYSKSDKFAHYIEAVKNPAEIFELTKFGKTYGYIKANVGLSGTKVDAFQSPYYQYTFSKRDVEVYAATEFVHACLDGNTSRSAEEVKLFLDDKMSDESSAYTYQVRRGQSLLYSAFKIWRELMLLENSILLNRITKSSIVRVIGVEVGSMAKESVGPHLQGIKSLIEQKSALKDGNYMEEYTNPGPVENNIYVPTRNGIGAISTQQIGGDVDVKSLADLDYFKNKFYGSFRVPKHFFGDTDDAAGFNGGTSLSLISSRYAKMVKRIQNTMVQALTDAINIMLLDKGLDTYINKFTIHMLPPTTQEEIDRRDNLSNKVSIVNDIMNNLNDVEDTSLRLKILKSLLSNTITDNEVIDLIQEQIDLLDEGATTEPSDNTPTMTTSRREPDFSPEVDVNVSTPSDEVTTDVEAEEGNEEETLPSPNDIGIDMTDNQTFSAD